MGSRGSLISFPKHSMSAAYGPSGFLRAGSTALGRTDRALRQRVCVCVCVRGREQCEERDESKQLGERERCEPLSKRERFTGEAGGERRAGVREHLGALGVTVGV